MTTTQEADAELARHIARIYGNAMQAAENAIDAMAYVAQQLEEHNKRNPTALQRAMEAAGITDMDRLSFARFREITDWPLYTKLASGCLRLGAMANRRKETT